MTAVYVVKIGGKRVGKKAQTEKSPSPRGSKNS